MFHPASHRAAVSWALALLFSTGLSAQVMREGDDPLGRLAFSDPRLKPAPATVPIEEAGAVVGLDVRSGWTGFLREAGGEWRGFVDRRSGRLEVAEGSGVPWIPGPGNSLSLDDIAPHLRDGGVDLAALERIARGFLPAVARMLGVDPGALALSRERSGRWADHFWTVDFDVLRDGQPIEGARVVFRLSQGNLVQFGTENLPSPTAAAPRKQVARENALRAVAGHIGGFSATDTFLDGGSLHLLPVQTGDAGFAEGFEPDDGRGLALVWQFLFKRKGVTGTWRARVDAATGELLEFLDANRYAQVTGGVYPDSYALGNETVLPMPFADLSSGGYTDAAGVYSYPGGTVRSTLNGRYVRIFDTCGAISQSAGPTGRIAFGASAGTDCATPGSGGPGNSHSSRTQFYHLNRAKEIARGWLPANSWLNGQLEANVNILSACNAYWDYYSVNFFRSGAGCGNTGEIVGVSLHEYGHGLDSNDGNGLAPDLGTAETYGDFTAALTTHDSCIGPGFWPGNCGGYGDPCTSCTGVRDIDWARRGSNTPHTVGNFTQTHCPSGGGYDGPCGQEGHCESYVSSEALWDLVARDLPAPGTAAAWSVVERLWYLTRATATSAFTCNTSTNPWSSDGCSAGSLWRTLRAADDDDGNLANGTPHSCALFAAFNRHGIACAADAGADVCFSGCTPPAAPALSASGSDGQVQLSWSSAGSGLVYDVYKSELGCDSGFIRIANDVSGLSLADTAVANGLAYSYQVIAHPGGNEACGAVPSACQAASPTAPPCPPVPAPGGVTAAAAGFNRIDLSWNAVPAANGYVIYRSAAAGGPYVEVGAVAAPATTFSDTGLAEGTTYHYVIRTMIGECESGNSQAVSATTGVCVPFILYSNDFESGGGLADWTTGSLDGGGAADWRGIQACPAHSGGKIFRFGGSTCAESYTDSQQNFAQPQGPAGIHVPLGGGGTRLSFWHRWSFEYGYDGGTLMLSVDGGGAVTIPASAIIAGATYDAESYVTGQPIFTALQSSFVNTVVDLDAACDLATGGTGGCGGRTLSIRFTTIVDSSIISSGWFLDDVAVTVCRPDCTPPATPSIGAATTPANNQIRVTWSNGAPAAHAFNVYRAPGTCAAPGSFTRRAVQVPGPSYLDSPVSGGSTFAYRVTGLDATGFCESAPSACVDATATGPCTLPLSFAGLASASSTAAQVCGVQLSWEAASSPCGHAVTYDVYRSTSPGFTPQEANRIAAGVIATSHVDTGLLTDSTTYYYVVRARDAVTGIQETNTVRRNATTRGPDILRTITETFEGAQLGGFDNPGWQHLPLSGPNDWTWSTTQMRSPSHSWLSPSHSSTADRVMISPPFGVGPGTRLSFWHTYEFDGCWDGGTLEISTDGGSSWQVLPDSVFTLGGFTDTLLSGSPIGGLRGWCRGTLGPMSEVRANLSPWAGGNVRLRWHAGEDDVIRYPGWYIDDVTISETLTRSACQPESTPRDFHTLAPCRLIDTRQPNGPRGGPILQPAEIRSFVLAGACGIPPTARALSVNITVVQPASFGHLTLYPDGQLTPNTSSINFRPSQTRANNGIVPLSDSNGGIRVHAATGGTVHLILDVNGYFE